MRFWKALQLSACAVLLCVTLGPGLNADLWNKKTIVTFSDAVEIPGQILPAGTYVFKLADSNANRHIVQIWNDDETQIYATIMTIPEYRLDPVETTTFEFDERPGDSPQALRTWFYPGETMGEEFVYSQY